MKAVGIIRQSRRKGEDGKSPAEQCLALGAYAKREGWTLVAMHEELDVSGGTPLERRRG